MDKDNKMIKVVVVGDSYVGKTSVCNAMMGKEFVREYVRTIGIDYKVKRVEDGYAICIWDLSGDKNFKFMFETFVTTSEFVLFCYSAENYNSFVEMKEMYEDYLIKRCLKDKKIIIIVTKVDSDGCYIDYEKDGKIFSEINGLVFIKTSSKNKYGIKELEDNLFSNPPEKIKEPDRKRCLLM
jgi:small GTP-binding protein